MMPPHIRTDPEPPTFPTLIKFAIILVVAIWISLVVGRNVAHNHIVAQCNKYERFHDGELRYFCRPWPYDEPAEEAEEDPQSSLATMIQS